MSENTKLSEEVRNRIARKALIRIIISEELFDSAEAIKRGVPDAAKDLDEKPEDLMAFMQEILPEVIGKKYGLAEVNIRWK